MADNKKTPKQDVPRSMPHNLEAEQCVLGCMLMDSDLAFDILPVLHENDFYTPSHKTIFNAVNKVHNARKTIDFVTVADELSRSGEMAAIGGISYLTSLNEIMPSAASYRDYLEIVKRDSAKRGLIRQCGEIIKDCYAAGDREKMIADAEKAIYDLNVDAATHALKPVRDSVGAVFSKLERIRNNPESLKGVLTGFRKLDELTNGLQPGNLIVVAGRPGQGKSSLAMNIVEHAAVHNDKVCAVFSLEMTNEEIAQRMLFSISGVSMKRGLSSEKLRPEETADLYQAHSYIANSKVYVDDSPVAPNTLLSRCRRLKSETGLDLIVIDYIQLMQDTKQKYENRQLEIASFTKELKQIAKELQVPIIALSQLNREAEAGNKRPQLSHLRESGAIEQDADMVMFIYNPEPDAAKAVEDIFLIVAKHRNGPTGDIALKWVKECVRFADPHDKLVSSYSGKSTVAYDDGALLGLEVPPETDGEFSYDE